MNGPAYDAAARRVDGDPLLRRFRDLLLWGFGDGGSRKHWQWVAQGNTAELLAWAREREESDGWEITPTPAAVADAGQWGQAALFEVIP